LFLCSSMRKLLFVISKIVITVRRELLVHQKENVVKSCHKTQAFDGGDMEVSPSPRYVHKIAYILIAYAYAFLVDLKRHELSS